MYKKPQYNRTGFNVNTAVQGETLETKIERLVTNKEPIGDTAPLIYTERIEGIQPSYDIRTDRFDVAIDAMDKVDKSYKARREERHNPKVIKMDTEGESVQGKNEGV